MSSPSVSAAPRSLHPIPVGGKAMLGPEPFRRFTVNSIGKIISIENPEIDEWGYSVTFDDDASHSKHIVTSNSTDVFKELTHADPEEMYTFLRTGIHPYRVGDRVKLLDPNDNNLCMAGMVEQVTQTSFDDEDCKYFYKVRMDGEGRLFRVYNGDKYLSPVNYPLTSTKWAIGKTIVGNNKKGGSRVGEKEVPEVEEVSFNYDFDVSLYLISLDFFFYFTYLTCVLCVCTAA